MNTGEIEVVGDANEPMATRPVTHHELRETRVVMIGESLDREANILGLHGRFGATGQRRHTTVHPGCEKR